MRPAQFKVKCKKEEYKPYYPKDKEDKHEHEYKVRLQCSNRLFLQSLSSAAGHAWLCDLRSGCVSTA